jgi:hypothetical protein
MSSLIVFSGIRNPKDLLKPVCVHDPKDLRAYPSIEPCVLDLGWTLYRVLPIITAVLLRDLDTVGSACLSNVELATVDIRKNDAKDTIRRTYQEPS